MVRHEFTFTRNMNIEDVFSLMVEKRGSHAGWKFEYDPSLYTIVWTPTILLNVWRMHPKVTAILEEVSKGKTRCRVITTNKGFIDPFGFFRRVHEKSYRKLFGPLKELTKEHEELSEE